jgi:hypothetical protein
MEVAMPSIAAKSLLIATFSFTACIAHSAIAQDRQAGPVDAPAAAFGPPAEPHSSAWLGLLDCANQDRMTAVSRTSVGTFVGSNLLTEQRAQVLSEMFLGAGTRAAGHVGPRIFTVAKSPPWKVASGLVALSTLAVAAYQFATCPAAK